MLFTGWMQVSISRRLRSKINRPFPSSPGPLNQKEVKCSAFDMEMIFDLFHCQANKTHFYKKGCSLGLILKGRGFLSLRLWFDQQLHKLMCIFIIQSYLNDGEHQSFSRRSVGHSLQSARNLYSIVLIQICESLHEFGRSRLKPRYSVGEWFRHEANWLGLRNSFQDFLLKSKIRICH